MRLADCEHCGAGIGFKGHSLCHRCRRRDAESRRRALCPSCGELLRLREDTGRCARCSRTCVDCGQVLRFKTSTRCQGCRRRHEARARKAPCPNCGRPGFLRAETGWCGTCSRPRRPLAPRPCTSCGELKRKKGDGLCYRCWSRHPDRPFTQTENLIATLEDPPEWLRGFADAAAARLCVQRACVLITAVGRLLVDGESRHPQELLERSRRSGRSAGTLARTLEEFFVTEGLAFGLDQDARLASGRRHRRVQGVPEPLRPAVELFGDHLVHARDRARRAGIQQRSDQTIEVHLAVVRDLARFLTDERHKHDWAGVDTGDIEAFLARLPASRSRRLGAVRQFFRFAKKNKLVLIDPARPLRPTGQRPFSGRTLDVAEQRRLLKRWSSDTDVHPHEALVGVLALLHAATSLELRVLTVDDVDHRTRSVQLGSRPQPTPLDPVSWGALERVLLHRDRLQTPNRHVLVTKATKTRLTTCSVAYLSHILDPAGVRPQRLRVTRLADLVVTLDPRLVAAALGRNPDGLLLYLANHVDDGRLGDIERQRS